MESGRKWKSRLVAASEEPFASASQPPLRLTATLVIDGANCHLALGGVLDCESIAALDTQIDQLACTPCALVVVDAADLVALDPVGSKALVGLGHYVRARGGTYCVLGARGGVATSLAEVSFSEDGWYAATAPAPLTT